MLCIWAARPAGEILSERSESKDLFCQNRAQKYGGERGIRTPGTLSGTAVFKTACFNHSHIPPREGDLLMLPRLVYNSLRAREGSAIQHGEC